MFLTPVFSTQMVLEPTFGPPKRDPASPTAPSIVSSASSDASFGFLDRRDSTSSNVSVSTDASSVPSVKPSPKPKHRKTLSSNSITRRLLQKRRPEQPQRKSEPPPTSSPVINSTPLAPLTPPPPPAPVALPPSPPVSEEKSSDLVVRCRSDVYHVDRVIMCYHSRWFARVCAVVMCPKSSAKGAIDLSADDPSAVAAMMQYCYQLDYVYRVSDFDNEGAEDDTLSAHVKVYMLAERYGVAGLRAVALQKFKQAAALVLNEDGKEEQLLLAIRVMYAPDRRANADDLRRVAVKLCADHVQDFIHDTGKKMALVYESMEEYPDFRAELFEEMGSRWRQ